MTKVLVVNEATGERMPFLRGVLVQSLVSTGLSFEAAYRLAQAVKNDLGETSTITSGKLREQVIATIEAKFGREMSQAFANRSPAVMETRVATSSVSKPFSVGILTRSLEACAIRHDLALQTARSVQAELQAGDRAEIDHLELRRLVCKNLLDGGSRQAANRYLSWRLFKESGKPLIILLGGITGTGKSTLAAELAFRLDVVRTQSTDMLREIVRGYLAAEEVPTLSYSSFEAWKGLAFEHPPPGESPSTDHLIMGFESQFSIVKKGLEATISRAVKERLDLIIDGIHVIPPRLDLELLEKEALMVPTMLVIASREILGQRLAGRSREQPSRGGSKYLMHLDEIWQLQSHLVGIAEEGDIPLLYNWEMKDTLFQMLTRVNDCVGAEFPADVDALL
ncbi:MAG: hypothetical protein KDI63_13015 [Gammaproteobacteria bacterium]|nr:hypothetical protein [Gammaproteobacteria bacterium]